MVTGVLEASGAAREWLLLVGGATLAALVAWSLATARARAAAAARLAAGEAELAGVRGALEHARGEASAARADLESERATRIALEREQAAGQARLQELQRVAAEQQAMLASAEQRLRDTFQALAAEALAGSEQRFLRLAGERLDALAQGAQHDLATRQQSIEGLVAPVRETLAAVDAKIAALESERREAYGRLHQQVDSLLATQHRLEGETARLVRALRAPAVRGRWGEVQLRRVVELAGMLEHCDFTEQVTLAAAHSEEGRLRPDLVVHLPGGRQIVVDAKVPLEAYLDAVACEDEELRKARLDAHAAQLRDHLNKLAAKAYWERLPGSPEFVVLFLPGEVFYSAALEAAPALMEEAMGRRVLIATPTTLIALLQTARLGWREERLAESAREISEQGRALHKTLVTFSEHWVAVGKALGKAAETYNAAVGSLESRVLPAARKLEELGAGSPRELPEQVSLTVKPRLLAGLAGRAGAAQSAGEVGEDERLEIGS